MRKKHTRLAVCLAAAVLAVTPAPPAQAAEAGGTQKTRSELEREITGYKERLSGLSATEDEQKAAAADLEEEIGALCAEEESLSMQIRGYADGMAVRIAYFYENNDLNGVLSALLGAGSLADVINAAEHQSAIHAYDAEKLAEYEALIAERKEKREELCDRAAELSVLLDEEEELKAELTEALKADEDELEAAKAYAAKRNCGALTKKKGVVWFGEHRETWYSQRVLPGGGLSIPGRHVDEDGLIRDADGYICVASGSLPKGTVVETSLGTGRVYDYCATPGTIDIYTDW